MESSNVLPLFCFTSFGIFGDVGVSIWEIESVKSLCGLSKNPASTDHLYIT